MLENTVGADGKNVENHDYVPGLTTDHVGKNNTDIPSDGRYLEFTVRIGPEVLGSLCVTGLVLIVGSLRFIIVTALNRGETFLTLFHPDITSLLV